MNETTIIVIRHGETVNNLEKIGGQKDSILSPRGIAQIDAIAERLSDIDLKLIFSSDLDRALQTA